MDDAAFVEWVSTQCKAAQLLADEQRGCGVKGAIYLKFIRKIEAYSNSRLRARQKDGGAPETRDED